MYADKSIELGMSVRACVRASQILLYFLGQINHFEASVAANRSGIIIKYKWLKQRRVTCWERKSARREEAFEEHEVAGTEEEEEDDIEEGDEYAAATVSSE